MKSSLIKFANVSHSQNGEDGILAEIFDRLGIEKGSFVEFGGGNGKDLSNTRALAEKGWKGVWIEADPTLFKAMEKEAATFDGRVVALQRMVGFGTYDNLDVILFEDNLMPFDFEFISIDIDSYDYEAWKAMIGYTAKVVLIEINSGIELGVDQRHNPGLGRFGTSFTTMMQLAQEKGYTLVCHTGNLIFVKDELVDRLKLPDDELDHPEQLFNDQWVRWAKSTRAVSV